MDRARMDVLDRRRLLDYDRDEVTRGLSAMPSGIAIRLLLALASCSLFLMPAARADEAKLHVVVVLDASGSMNGVVEGTKKIDKAVSGILEVRSELLGVFGDRVELGLWVFGDLSDKKEHNCADYRLAIPLGQGDSAAWEAELHRITPRGYTPLEKVLQSALGTLVPGKENMLLVVGDGDDNCDGDPCGYVRGSVSMIPIFVLDVGKEPSAGLRCLPRITGGVYARSGGIKSLLDGITGAFPHLVGPGTLRVEVVNPLNQTLAVKVTETGTDNIVQWFQGSGKTSLPSGVYDVEVFSVPPIVQSLVTVSSGRESVVRFDEFGSLRLSIRDFQGTELSIPGGVYEEGSDDLIEEIVTGVPFVLTEGRYDILLRSRPNRSLNGVEVEKGTERRLLVGQYGEFAFEVDPALVGDEQFVGSILDSVSGEELAVLPSGQTASLLEGRYALRIEGLPGSKLREILVPGGKKVTFAIRDLGRLRLQARSADDKPVVAFGRVYDGDSGLKLADLEAGGSVLLEPGGYIVEVTVGRRVLRKNVLVTAGKEETASFVIPE
jgi:Ca-activated chloride channel family protein